MNAFKLPKPVLRDDVLYMGDGGRLFCGAHAGMTARFTGVDLRGARCRQVTPALAAAFQADGLSATCERCDHERARRNAS